MWIVTISGIPDRHVNINPASRAQIVASPASRGTIKSRIPSIYLSFSRFPHRILVKSRIPKIPFQTLLIVSNKLILDQYIAESDKYIGLRQMIDLRDTDKSQYLTITEFNNCFLLVTWWGKNALNDNVRYAYMYVLDSI